ncbi:MAG: extracellular solute-binding protein [Acutalibacter sp.]
MKRKILAVFLALCMSMSLAACNGGGTSSTSGSTESGAEASGTTAETPENFNAEGLPIVNEPITVDTWIEGGTDIDWTNNGFVNTVAEESGIQMEITAVSGADSVTQRNLRLASGDFPDVFMLDWTSIMTFTDIMQYGVQEQILAPIDQYIEPYSENMGRILEEHPDFADAITATDGHIYGFPRFSECYHCLAYPKFYIRQDWLDALNLEMPTTTDELKDVLTAFVTQDPNGNGQADEIGLLGGTDFNLMLEYGIIGNSFVTVKPDFWLYTPDGENIDISVTTDAYRDGLIYLNDLYANGLIDPTSFTNDSDQFAQTVRLEPYIVGMYCCDHIGMGYDNANVDEAKNYQIVPVLEGPDGVRQQSQNSGEGQIQGFHAVMTVACENPEAVFRMIDHYFYDDYWNMYRFHGPEGTGWDYAEEGAKNVFGGPATYVINQLSSDESDALVTANGFAPGPQADLAEFRAASLPYVEGDALYQPENYEQRIALDTMDLLNYIPDWNLQYSVFIDPENANEYADIQTNLNSYIRSATVQFIMGDRDPNNDADWETYLSELDGYQIDRYLELYKEAGRIVSNEGLGEVDTGSSDDTSSTAETSESSVAEESSTVESSAVESSAVESAAE